VTFGRRDAAVEPTGMYSRRVTKRPTCLEGAPDGWYRTTNCPGIRNSYLAPTSTTSNRQYSCGYAFLYLFISIEPPSIGRCLLNPPESVDSFHYSCAQVPIRIAGVPDSSLPHHIYASRSSGRPGWMWCSRRPVGRGM